MSFVENGKDRLIWVARPIQRSVLRVPGCTQCGRQLEMSGFGLFALSGKCENCASGFHEGDDRFDDCEF